MTTTSTSWSELLQRADPQDLGDPAGEIAALASATVVSPLADFAVIRASGEEAADFLHNLLTNDVKNLDAATLRRAGFCTAKGRLLADFRIWREGDDIYLALAADIQPAILKKLSMFILRAKAKLQDASGERLLLGLAGPAAAALVAGLAGETPAPGATKSFADGVILGFAPQRFVIAARADSAASLWQKLSAEAKPVGTTAWRAVEIAAGEPRIVVGTQEEFIPQMINFVQVGGLSFKKGCYPGQEIVARTQYLGKIKRHMVRAAVAADSAEAAPGTPIYAPETGEQACGNVVISAPAAAGGSEALLVVQNSCAEAGQLFLGKPGGPALSLLALPYALE